MGNRARREVDRRTARGTEGAKPKRLKRASSSDAPRLQDAEGSGVDRLSVRRKGRTLRASRGVAEDSGHTKRKNHRQLRAIKVGDAIRDKVPSIPAMVEEVQDMTDILLGRVPAPIDFGILTLQETADMYFARAAEMTMAIQGLERQGVIPSGSGMYKFRTGELRTFMEMCKRAAELGSRRLTEETTRLEQERLGRESRGSVW